MKLPKCDVMACRVPLLRAEENFEEGASRNAAWPAHCIEFGFGQAEEAGSPQVLPEDA